MTDTTTEHPADDSAREAIQHLTAWMIEQPEFRQYVHVTELGDNQEIEVSVRRVKRRRRP